MIIQTSDSCGGGQDLGRKRNNAMMCRSEYRTSVVVLHHHMNVLVLANTTNQGSFALHVLH